MPNLGFKRTVKFAELEGCVNAAAFEPENQVDQTTIAEHVQLLDRLVVDLQQR